MLPDDVSSAGCAVCMYMSALSSFARIRDPSRWANSDTMHLGQHRLRCEFCVRYKRATRTQATDNIRPTSRVDGQAAGSSTSVCQRWEKGEGGLVTRPPLRPTGRYRSPYRYQRLETTWRPPGDHLGSPALEGTLAASLHVPCLAWDAGKDEQPRITIKAYRDAWHTWYIIMSCPRTSRPTFCFRTQTPKHYHYTR